MFPLALDESRTKRDQQETNWYSLLKSGLVHCLISYRAEAWHYRIFPEFLKSPVSKWRIVGVKTRTKAFFFEEILINIPSQNLSKLSKEMMQYFCHALKINVRSRHSASASNCSRSLEPNMIINFLQQRILCLILPAYEK